MGCAGGSPLLHSARALPTGDVRATLGLSANVAGGGLGADLRRAKEIAAQNPNTPGPAGSNPDYAKGALVAAAVSPGVAPFVAARVGVGNRFDAGLAYTGRAVRIDARRSFDSGRYSLSIGAGGTAALYGRQSGSELSGVDMGSLHGYGADVPILVGWQSAGALYQVWTGVRGGFEHDTISEVTSEPKSVTIGTPPLGLSADRFYGGGVLGIATGLRHIHVALEVAGYYENVSGAFNGTNVKTQGFTVIPATALWWTF
jgi:hypothetical protein